MKQQTRNQLLFFAIQLVFQFAFSQSPVAALTTTYISTSSPVTAYTNTPAPSSGTFTGCASSNYSYRFNTGTNNALKLLSITANGRSYFVSNASANIKLRRSNNASVNGQRSIIFLESNSAVSGCPSSMQFGFKSPYQDQMETFLSANYINQGTDNIFTNSGNGDGNNNNIERVDVIFPAGISSSSTIDAGFALFDRGVNNNHDGFRITAITSLNASGDPKSFGPVLTCVKGTGSGNGSWGHPSVVNGNVDLSVYVMRKEAAESRLRSSAAIDQQIGGVFFSFSDLGVSANQTIYGYALIGPDGNANPTSAQLLNLNDPSVYPKNTTENVGGGLDLIAINASFSTGVPTLPIKIVSFEGHITNDLVKLNWRLEDAANESKVVVERFADGLHFTPVFEKLISGAYDIDNYKEEIQSTNQCYRLKLVNNQVVSYSEIIWLRSEKINNIKLYPGLLHANQPIIIEGLTDDCYKIFMVSTNGEVLQKRMEVFNGKAVFPVSSSLPNGMYHVSIQDMNGQTIKRSKVILLKN